MFLGNNSTLPPEAENVKWISLGDGKNYTYYQFSKMIRTNKAIHLALSTSIF
jgi:hypothetical protein